MTKFNPKNLPLVVMGECDCDEHEGEKKDDDLHLVMSYSDGFESDNDYVEGTEEYWCEDCLQSTY